MQLTFSPPTLVQQCEEMLEHYNKEVAKCEAKYEAEIEKVRATEVYRYGLFWRKTRPLTEQEAAYILEVRGLANLEGNWTKWQSALCKAKRFKDLVSAFKQQTTLVKISEEDWKFIFTGNQTVH